MRRSWRIGRGTAIAFAASLMVAGTAIALGLGLQSEGFEDGLTGWELSSTRHAGNGTAGDDSGKPNRELVYGPGGERGAVLPCRDDDPVPPSGKVSRYGACLITGEDTFTTGSVAEGNLDTVTVNTPEGDNMVRLGGPYNNFKQKQKAGHGTMVEQTFTVDASEPILRLRHRLFSYERLGKRAGPFMSKRGRDNVRYMLFYQGQQLLPRFAATDNTRFDYGEGRNLRSTGWRDLKLLFNEPLYGEEITVVASMTSRVDDRYGSWAYVEADTKPKPAGPPPPVDSDGDGVPDGQDLCPSQPGPSTNSGCPLPDSSGGGGDGGGTIVVPARDTTPPALEITTKLAKTSSTSPTIKFDLERDATATCKLDGKSVEDCDGAVKLKKLKKGKHTFTVTAVDQAGNTATDTITFTVKPKKKGGKGK